MINNNTTHQVLYIILINLRCFRYRICYDILSSQHQQLGEKSNNFKQFEFLRFIVI